MCQEHATQILRSELQEEAVRDVQPTRDHRTASAQPQHVAPENSSTTMACASLVIVEQSQQQTEEAVDGQEGPCCSEMKLRLRRP